MTHICGDIYVFLSYDCGFISSVFQHYFFVFFFFFNHKRCFLFLLSFWMIIVHNMDTDGRVCMYFYSATVQASWMTNTCVRTLGICRQYQLQIYQVSSNDLKRVSLPIWHLIGLFKKNWHILQNCLKHILQYEDQICFTCGIIRDNIVSSIISHYSVATVETVVAIVEIVYLNHEIGVYIT